MIGRTVYFCKDFKFSFFESLLQKSNCSSKYENFIFVLNHIVWPIKWKGIFHRITIWNQKMTQYNSKEPALKIKGQIYFYFEDCSKSAWGMILFLLVTCSYTPILLKNAEKPTVIWLFTQNSFKSTVYFKSFWVILSYFESFWIILSYFKSFWVILRHFEQFLRLCTMSHFESFWFILCHFESL